MTPKDIFEYAEMRILELGIDITHTNETKIEFYFNDKKVLILVLKIFLILFG